MIERIKEHLKKGFIWIDFHTFIDELSNDIDGLYKLKGYFAYIGFSFVMRSDWAYADKVKERFDAYR